MFFVPFQVKAGFFSSLFGTEVSASVDETGSTQDTDKTCQSRDLSLQANVSSALVIENKKSTSSKDGEINGDVSVNIVSDNALMPATSLGGCAGTNNGDAFSDQISVYVIRKGDSLEAIAKMFDVSVNTILWANDMKKGDKLIEGNILFILPVSGVKHVVSKGQTLKGIAKKYNVDVSDIAGYNGIAQDAQLNIGDELIVPDGEVFEDGGSGSSSSTNKNPSVKQPTRNLAGYFINPVPSAIRTQKLHGKNAVDLAAPIGTPILASASGTVLLARNGWNGAYGNMVIIQHSNGTQTLYSHLSKLGTHTGAKVYQGEIIGYVGNTGRVRSSKGGNGSHLHFEVYGAKNPGATTPMSFASL
ncbi:LysM peptidoglycan-binding domain-containing M23 family metallopeptidase [Patescibacteria group bacterium]|nr:LysM peptidoglycan-binding domain-containing M23 family metallopeptidase [Patescibacteria group bacterium]